MSLRNSSLFCLLLSLILLAAPVTAFQGAETDHDPGISSEKLPWSKDLLAESRQAACHGQPLVVMFGSSTCPYCSVVRSLYMIPLMSDERYPGIISRELEIDSAQLVRDFSGKWLPMSELASKYGVTLVPQVVVFGPDGEQAGKPLIGISNEDFYGVYLDQAIIAGSEMVKMSREKYSSDAPSVLPGAYACD